MDTLLRDIENALAEDKLTKDTVIEVSNNQGIVTLSGEVKSKEIADRAEELAKKQKGALTVINNLKIVANDNDVSHTITTGTSL